jgi:hypothetical protein
VKTFLLVFLIVTSAYAQDKKTLSKNEILKFSMEKIQISKGLEKNWKKCFGTEAPDLKNFLDIPTAIMTANAIKQLKTPPEAAKSCEAALDPSYTFAAEAVCLLDESVAKNLYDLTEDDDALIYLTLLETTTAEMKADGEVKKEVNNHAENAKDMLEFLRKFNKKKIASMPKK